MTLLDEQTTLGGLEMDKTNLDDLLNTLGFIALYKSMLPFSLPEHTAGTMIQPPLAK